MADYGGLGGVMGGRALNTEDAFEMAVKRALGDRLATDNDLCEQMWSALANVYWTHENGDTASYSFRAAGDLIAAVRGRGEYIDWYCSGNCAVVSDEIEQALAAEGWRWNLET